jgi:DNA-binding beta-propeller fold protein YncE
MKKRTAILLVLILANLIAACAQSSSATTGAETIDSTQALPMTGSTPSAVPTDSPRAPTAMPAPTNVQTAVPTNRPVAISVEFVLEITGGPEPLSWPSGMAIDAQGNLYVVDTMNHRIQIFDSSGNFLTTWGSKGSGDGQFNFIWGDPNHDLPLGGLAFDQQGNLYVADGGNKRIQKFDSQGNFLAKWGSQGTGDGQFGRPEDLVVDAQGNLVVIDDRSNNRIQRFDSQGEFLARLGVDLINDPGLIAVDGQDNIYAPDVSFGTILKLDPDGNLLATWGGNGVRAGEFLSPIGIALDSQGNIYVVDSGNSRVQVLDANGNFLYEWGDKGSEAGQFSEPFAIEIDSQGNIYVSDYLNNRVQKFRLTE